MLSLVPAYYLVGDGILIICMVRIIVDSLARFQIFLLHVYFFILTFLRVSPMPAFHLHWKVDGECGSSSLESRLHVTMCHAGRDAASAVLLFPLTPHSISKSFALL
jgi:hypothetical protein